MLTLWGYQVTEKLLANDRTIIYRGYDEQEHKPVILKVLQFELATIEEMTRLRQEYQIPQELDCEGVVKSYS